MGKQYYFIIPYITYWGCDTYHWIRFHKSSYSSLFGNRINKNIWFTITCDKWKFSLEFNE